jgi:hypothetical protein
MTIGIVTSILGIAIITTGPVGITVAIIGMIFDVSAFFENSYDMIYMFSK